MSDWTIPGTDVTATVLPAVGHFSQIFRHTPTTGDRLMSVDAGDSGLYVGGGGINAQFGKEVPQAGSYGRFHSQLLQQAQGDPSRTAVQTSFAAGDPPLRWACVLAPEDSVLRSNEGATFLDVFSDDGQPHGVAENAALLYISPPDGRSRGTEDEAGFLSAVTLTATTIVAAARTFNDQHADDGGGAIPVLRMSFYSSSTFLRPGTATGDITQAIYDGLVAGLWDPARPDAGITLVEFPHGAGFEALAPS